MTKLHKLKNRILYKAKKNSCNITTIVSSARRIDRYFNIGTLAFNDKRQTRVSLSFFYLFMEFLKRSFTGKRNTHTFMRNKNLLNSV